MNLQLQCKLLQLDSFCAFMAQVIATFYYDKEKKI